MGSASVTWWGTLAFMLIEATGFALAIVVSLAATWPIDAPQPDLPGTLVTVILIAGAVPNYLVSQWAEQQDVRKVRIGMVVMSIVGIAPLLVRAFEFPALNVSWDSNAYGSNFENDQKRNEFGTVWLPDYSACGQTSLSVEFGVHARLRCNF